MMAANTAFSMREPPSVLIPHVVEAAWRMWR